MPDTPAETLTAAANRIDDVLAGTNPGPWWGDDIDEVQSADGQLFRAISSSDGRPYQNSRYAALMNPQVGEQLSRWLKAEAQEAIVVGPALAVARLLLGETAE
ncbi:hypothetical protein [Kitasatospora indigofera]|uniref:hypothetical protein n=1 Tax=Kitasatospora indigofera TaxID=67307 RepID=UPI0036BE7EFF